MAKPFDLVEDTKKFDKLIKSIDFLNDHAVYVGIPQSNTERDEENSEGITNAELLFIHTNGSPARNIPPRPVIEPAIYEDRERLNSMLSKVVEYALDGKEDKALNELKRTGMRAQNVSRAWFVNDKNGWPPDKPGTIEAKKRKHKDIEGYEPRTLIDTAQMRNSITYFVEGPEGRTK